MRTAVFGGTFDPPHNGHTGIAEELLSRNLCDKVLFVPAWTPPHKISLHLSSPEARLEMLRQALHGKTGMEISLAEYERKSSFSYTVDTLKVISDIYHNDKIILLIGSDSLCNLHTWHRAAEIINAWQILSYPRKDHIPLKAELAAIWGPETAEKLIASLITMPFFEISSTEIRNRIAKNENVDNLLNAAVLKYIRDNDLYRQ